jgi:hypothetical protein
MHFKLLLLTEVVVVLHTMHSPGGGVITSTFIAIKVAINMNPGSWRIGNAMH